MYLHLIMMTVNNGRLCGYHFVSTNENEINQKHQDLVNQLNDDQIKEVSFRVIKTDRPDFRSIESVDSYYQHMTTMNQIDQFKHMIDQNLIQLHAYQAN